MLHQDPRYFRKGEGGFAARTFYAVSRVLVTRTDSGRHTLNSSEILGNLASSGVSNLYYPDDERSWQDVFSRAGTRIGVHALRFTLKEFAPDIIRKLKHKGRLEDAPESAEIPDKN